MTKLSTWILTSLFGFVLSPLNFSLSLYAQTTTYQVVRVIDGDTVVLDTGDQVRLIGIDTPEIAESGKPVECFGDQATYYLTKILEGREVWLTYSGQTRRDAFNRILAYLYRVEGGIDVNKHLLQHGYATNYIRFPHRRQTEFTQTEARTRNAQKGFFGTACQGSRQLTVPIPTSPAPTTALPESPPFLQLAPRANVVTNYYQIT